MTTTKAYNEHELSNFMQSRILPKSSSEGSIAAVTGMGEKKGKWKISDEDYPKFLDLLHDYLFVKHGRCMNFVEQPRKGEPKPLLIDLDFRYSADTSLTRAFSLSHIESFIHSVVEGLKEFFELESYEVLRFFVTLRPAPYKEGSKQKDGVHILCPDMALLNEKQGVLRNWLLNKNTVKNSFANTGYTNPDNNVYDECMTHKQGWIFFGESKPNIAPYQLETVFAYTPETNMWIQEDTSQYSTRNLIEILSVRYNIVEDINDVKDDAKDTYSKLLNTVSAPVDNVAPVSTEGQNAIIDAINYIYGGKTLGEQELLMVRRFVLDCLKDSWYEDYDKWIRVGWCLNNIGQTEEMFTLYKEFSERSGKAGETDWEKIRRNWFSGMGKTGDGPRLTERSLRKWARDDNPKVYNEIISGNLHEFILGEIEASHYHISTLMKKMYGNNYVASVNPKSTEWFKYDDDINMWKRINQGIELKTKISIDVASEIATVRGVVSRQWGEEQREERKEYLAKKMKDLIKVEAQLYSNGFTESVMKMATQQFCEEEFMNKLNIDPFLFGCRNGVLELRAKDGNKERVIFRQGRPEDYISFLAGRNYPDSEAINYVPYNPRDPMQIEIADFFAKLFPRKDLCAYVLRLLASCLEGANREQCYYTFTGAGGNGKSKLIELMRLTFGDYQTSMSSTVLTRSRPQAGAANPELMVTKCRRFIYMQEPDEKEPINTSIMKQFSGEDIIEARQLYGEQDKFRIMGKICMMCNTLPPVTSMDEGTWRRIRVVPFESTFLPPDHPGLLLKKPNNFPRDPKLDEKLRQWREPFLSLLVHVYDTEYIKSGLNPVPDIVLQASNKYKENFDVIAKFDADRIREPNTDADRLNCRTTPVDTNFIKNAFKIWKNEQQIKFKDDNQLISRLSAKYGDPERGKYWTGIFVFDSDISVTEWDEERTPTTG
jgi:P4 family phage/plasmid primase-like protien